LPTEITPADIKPANVLSVTIVPSLEPFTDPVLISTAADRSLRLFSAAPPYVLLRHFPAPADSAILSIAVVDGKHLLISTMTGRLSLLSATTGETLASIRPHEKYAIRVLYHAPYVISAAYDKSICVHTLSGESFSQEPVGRLSLPTPPEALAVVSLSDNKGDAIVFARRDSTKLYYHLLVPGLPAHSARDLAPNAYLVYHAMSISPSPQDPSLLAIATNAMPHMKLLLVRVDSDEVLAEWFTGAPQSAYSTAVVAWRPDGSGVWVNADEGVVRGVEVKTGKVRARIQVGTGVEKVRTLWAGAVEGVGECLVTGGFDKGLRVWTVKEEEGGDGVAV
jgi:WD40 repeat protein